MHRRVCAASLLLFAVLALTSCSVSPLVEHADRAVAVAAKTQIDAIFARMEFTDVKRRYDEQSTVQDKAAVLPALKTAESKYRRLLSDANEAAFQSDYYTTVARNAVTATKTGASQGMSAFPVLLAKAVPIPHTSVTLLFGTDRHLDPNARGARNRFTGLRGPESPSLGLVTVSVPDTHKLGRVERPSANEQPSPAKHMVMDEPQILQTDEFARELAAARRKGSRQVLVFVHGYNVTFEDAALRTAQIAVDLELNAVPTFYSWPSLGALKDYPADDENATWAIPHFKAFLKTLMRASADAQIVLIAHSMGTRLTTTALKELLTEEPVVRNRFKEIVLAAPDIDADVFVNQILPVFVNARQSVTLYASSKDKALATSRTVRGHPRAGEAGANIVVRTGLETVDASAIDTDFLAHSYFAEARPLLTDISMLLKNGLRAENRHGLREVRITTGRYWRFRE